VRVVVWGGMVDVEFFVLVDGEVVGVVVFVEYFVVFGFDMIGL